MKQDGAGSQSKRSLTLRRSKPRGNGERAQEDPRTGGGGQSARVPSGVAGVRQCGDDHQATNAPVYVPSPDDATKLVPSDAPVPEPELSHYKGVSLKNVGRDKHGRVIPHKRSEPLAKQISVWVAGGFNVNDIAIRINVRPGLIKENYATELAMGETKVHMDVHGHILKRVKQSDRMAIFYAKARMGYRDGETANKDQSVLNLHIHL